MDARRVRRDETGSVNPLALRPRGTMTKPCLCLSFEWVGVSQRDLSRVQIRFVEEQVGVQRCLAQGVTSGRLGALGIEPGVFWPRAGHQCGRMKHAGWSNGEGLYFKVNELSSEAFTYNSIQLYLYSP